MALSNQERDDFAALVLRYLDDGCSEEEVAQLHGSLSGSAALRECFVRVCRMHGELSEIATPKLQPAPAGAASAKSVSVPTDEAPLSRNGLETDHDLGLANRPDKSAPASNDPGAETLLGDLTGEDTIHPLPKEPPSANSPP